MSRKAVLLLKRMSQWTS